MQPALPACALPEEQFAELVDSLAADPDQYDELASLLREDHPIYDERGASTIVRMRGWVLVAFARAGLRDSVLPFVLEELDAGTDAYLVAAAARVLRSCRKPGAALAPFVMRALDNIRCRDDAVSFERYGGYAVGSAGTSPVRELLATLRWLGPHARGVLPDIESLRTQLPGKLRTEVDRAAEAIRDPGRDKGDGPSEDCCSLPGLGALLRPRSSRAGSRPVETVVFEDQDGASITFEEFFRGQPSIVVFFYTRCDNPLKCSLSVTKLGRIQKLLEARGFAGQVRTAAVTYDPAFDLPGRLRRYGQERGVRFDAQNRMLRAPDGNSALRGHFRLGVNFVGSLVNRHRIELFVLDAEGRIAATFERLRWDEDQVVDRAAEVLTEGMQSERASPRVPADGINRWRTTSSIFGTLSSVAFAFFPKCPACWAAYVSMLGIAGLQIPYPSRLEPLLVVFMLINAAGVFLRARATGRMGGALLVCAGALAIFLSKLEPGWTHAALGGVTLTLAGSLASAVSARPKAGELPGS